MFSRLVGRARALEIALLKVGHKVELEARSSGAECLLAAAGLVSRVKIDVLISLRLMFCSVLCVKSLPTKGRLSTENTEGHRECELTTVGVKTFLGE